MKSGKTDSRSKIPSDSPAAGKSAGAPGPGRGKKEESSLFHQAGVCFKFGRKLLRASPGLAALFLALSLANMGLTRAVPELFGKITKAIIAQAGGGGQEEAASIAPEPATAQQADGNERKAPPEKLSQEEVKKKYLFWIVLSIGVIAAPFALKLVTKRFDGLQSNALRDQLFKRIVRQAPEFFHKNPPGALTMTLNRMSIEAQLTLRQFMLEPVVQVAGLVTSGILIVNGFKEIMQGGSSPWVWAALGALLIIAILSPWLSTLASTRMLKAGMAARGQMQEIETLVNGVVKSPEEIQAMRSEALLEDKHRHALEKLRRVQERQTVSMEVVNSVDDIPLLIVKAGLLGLAIYGGIASGGNAGEIAGALVAIVMQAELFMSPIQALGSQIVMLRMGWPSVEAVTSMLEDPPRIQDSPQAKVIDKPGPGFRVSDLSFAYRPELPKVFDGISFEAPAGKITGLVAGSGQGKTTLFRLALRYYEPDSGRIEIGGHAPADFTLESLRTQVFMLSQYPAWFHDTLRENMRMANAKASDEEIRAACEATKIWPILAQKFGSNPLDAQLAGGGMLSGGQRKLLALARGLLNNPSFLFLDEPTAGVDNDRKYLLIPDLKEACAGKTTIIVDHDVPWLISICDYFIVLEGGQIVQRGTKEELLAREGLFRSLAILPAEPLMPLFAELQKEGILDDVMQSQASEIGPVEK